MNDSDIMGILYLVAAVLFILSIRSLGSPASAMRGIWFGIIGMILTIATTLIDKNVMNYKIIFAAIVSGGFVGYIIAVKIAITSLPQWVGAFNAFGGLSSVLVSIATFFNPVSFGLGQNITDIGSRSIVEISLGILIGSVTFSGSIVAFAKLQGLIRGNAINFKGQQLLNLLIFFAIVGLIASLAIDIQAWKLWTITSLSIILGVTTVIAIGGADMPVVVSFLNSYSGFAAAAVGFTIQNVALIVVGAIVGASGAILSYIMCKAMNRSLVSVLLGGFGTEETSANANQTKGNIKSGNAEDAAFILTNAEKVIIVPGYGMAVSHAQNVIRQMSKELQDRGVKVSFAIHPVAGRMPGHMNVLLAEANVPYDEVFALEQINNDFSSADVAFVIGANDIVNPAAKNDKSSPIYGMPILEAENAKTVLFLKRSLNSGYAGIENSLFYNDNTMMIFGDAKEVVEKINQAITVM